MAIAAQPQAAGKHPVSRTPVHGAAHWRKRLRRELQRVRAGEVSLYVDGPRGLVHVRFPKREDRLSVGVDQAVRSLHALPDGAGVEATHDALARI